MTQLLNSSVMTAAEATTKVQSIDLAMVRIKLADPDEGNGWSKPQPDAAIAEYVGPPNQRRTKSCVRPNCHQPDKRTACQARAFNNAARRAGCAFTWQ